MKRHALFVGVNDYADEAFKNLRYSLSDAVALSGAFAARSFDVEVLSNPKAETVLDAVERKAAGLGLGDVFLFFFAGHGFTAPDGSHLLICANDRLAYLRHNRAGIPVDLLEEITNGRGCNRAFLLDACRTDVFAGVENRGAETRDLALVSLPDAKVHGGTCCVLRSCDRFCPAMEFDDLGHGVFTRAVMDVLDDGSFCATPFGEAFVAGIRSRMHVILSAHSAVGTQNPCFQTNGEAFFLFDDAAPDRATPPPTQSAGTATPVLVKCPVCGRWRNKTETFDCLECGRESICIDHQDPKTFLCADCTAKAKARCAADEKARRYAEEKAHLEVLPKPGDVEKLVQPSGGEGEHKKIQLWKGGPYWAETNLGAQQPWESGYYFWWGDTVGYKFEDDNWVASDGSSRGEAFVKMKVPNYGKDFTSLLYKRWITEDGTLAPEHDAAQVQWGGGWRMPTQQELLDLCNKCDWKWKKLNGVGGYVIRGRRAYASASIFLSCAGIGNVTSLTSAGSYGSFWSSVPHSDYGSRAWYLYFNSSEHGMRSDYRYFGSPVRPVQGFIE